MYVYLGAYLELSDIFMTEEVKNTKTTRICVGSEHHKNEKGKFCSRCGSKVEVKIKEVIKTKKVERPLVNEYLKNGKWRHEWQDEMVRAPITSDKDNIILFPNHHDCGELVSPYDDDDVICLDEVESVNYKSKLLERYKDYINWLEEQGFNVQVRFGFIKYWR